MKTIEYGRRFLKSLYYLGVAGLLVMSKNHPHCFAVEYEEKTFDEIIVTEEAIPESEMELLEAELWQEVAIKEPTATIETTPFTDIFVHSLEQSIGGNEGVVGLSFDLMNNFPEGFYGKSIKLVIGNLPESKKVEPLMKQGTKSQILRR